jgi:hypothetical protein
VCTENPERRADGGTYLVAIEGRADDVTSLMAALRLPDAPPDIDGCPAGIGASPLPFFALLDKEGHWLRPSVPANECDNPRAEVRNAIESLKLTRVSTRVLSVIESPEAIAAGCVHSISDMISLEARNMSVRPGKGVNPFAGNVPIRRCVYRVPADQQGTFKPAGTFEDGGILPPDRLALIGQALAAAGPARACSTLGSRFAMLSPGSDRYPAVYVELDGCFRILLYSTASNTGVLAQGDAALARLLGEH